MTKEEYIEAKKRAGHTLHFHNGVWWETTRKRYCKPAIGYEAYNPLEVRPGFGQCFIGYNHRVIKAKHASGFWQPFIMDEKTLNEWSLDTLENKNRRRRIRKGLRNR